MNFYVKNRYFFAALWFVVLNVAFIALQTIPLESPRLGDDALSYLAKITKVETNYSFQTPSMKDYYEFREHQNPNTTEETQYRKDRAFMRVRATLSPAVNPFLWLIHQVGFSLKWTWFVWETVVIFLLSFGIVRLQKVIAPSIYPELALIVISTALFPNQGLHFFVNSVAAFALGLILFSLVLQKPIPRFLLVFIVAFFLLGTHKVGRIYGGMAGLLLLWNWVRTRNRRYLILTLPLLICLIFYVLVDYRLGNMNPTRGEGGLTFRLPLISENFTGFLNDFLIWIRQSPQVLLFMILWIAVWMRKKAKVSSEAQILFILFSGMICVGMFFYVPTYPAEVVSRIFVGWGVVLCLVGVSLVAQISKKIQSLVLLLVGVGVVFSAKNKLTYAYENINRRNISFDERKYKNDFLSEVKNPEAQIIFCESEYSAPIHFVAVGEKYSVVPYPMFLNDPFLSEVMNRGQEQYLIMPQPPFLNFLSHLGVRSLSSRRTGFPLQDQEVIQIQLNGLRQIFLRLEKGKITIKNQAGGAVEIQATEESKWHPVPFAGKTFELSGKGWLSGISLNAPNEKVLWPWDQGVKLNVQLSPSQPSMPFQFSLQETMKTHDCSELISYVDFKNVRVVSDRSGLVFMRIK